MILSTSRAFCCLLSAACFLLPSRYDAALMFVAGKSACSCTATLRLWCLCFYVSATGSSVADCLSDCLSKCTGLY